MAINFPNPATLNQTYTVGTKTWVYNGYAWDLVLANTAPILSVASMAFTQANTGVTIAQAGFTQANTGVTIAQAGFTQVNTGVTIATAAFARANTETIGQAAFLQANTGITIAQAGFTQANTGAAIGQAAFGVANTGVTIAQAGFTQANTGVTIAQAAYNTANTKFSSSGGTISGSVTITTDLNVTGNVYLGGNVTTLSSNNLSINDPLIYLAQNNPGNVQDIGVVGHFTSGLYQHTGIVRDATDGIWKLFSNVAVEPTTTIDFTGAIYDVLQVGTVNSSNANFTVATGTAPLTVSSTTVVTNLNSDYLDGQHGTYYTGLIGSAWDTANTGVTIGQAAFTQANTGVTIAQAAFARANTETIGQAAFTQANTGVTIAQAGFTQANTGAAIGQAAFGVANTKFSSSGGTITGNTTVIGVVTGNTFVSTIATGTAPLTVSSTTVVTNLNVDYLDGQHGSYYTTAGNLSGTIPSAVLGNSTHYIGTTAVTLNRASASQTLTGVSISGSAASVANAVTFNNGGAGAVSGTTFNGSAATTISYNSIGASPLAGSSSITTTGTVTSGTWSGSFGAVSGANLTGLTAGNLSGTIPSTVIANSKLVDWKNQTAQFALTGGGTVTTTTAAILWSARVIAIPVENSEYSASGYIDITCPTSGTVVYYNGSNITTTVTCTAAGIPLAVWEALYYQVTEGQTSTSDQTKFRVVSYQNSTWSPGVGWICIAVRNGDDNSFKWLPGQVNIPQSSNYVSSTGIGSWGSPVAGSSSITTTGTVTSGTWSASFGAVSGANLTGLTAENLSGTIPSAVLGNSTHYIGTTAIALNRSSASQALTGISSIDGTSAGITGGAANRIVYQTNSGTTSFIAAPTTASRFLQWNGSAFAWAAAGGSDPTPSIFAINTGII